QCLARTPIPSGLGSGRFSPDGRRLVLYSVPNKAASLVAFDPATARVLWQVRGAGDYQGNYPFFDPTGRAVIGFRGAQLAWRDVTTGNVITSLHLPLWVSDLTTLPACMFQRTADSRFFLVHEVARHADPDRDSLESIRRDWLPDTILPKGPRDGFVSVVDLVEARETVRLTFRDAVKPVLSEDGQTLLMLHEGDGEHVLHCWDVPLQKPWRWVLGPPLCLAGVLFGLQYRRQSRYFKRNQDQASTSPREEPPNTSMAG